MASQAEGPEEEMEEEDMEQSDQMDDEIVEQQHVVENDDDDDEDKDAQELAQMLEGVDDQKDLIKEEDDEFRQILRGGQEIETGPDNHYGLEADDDHEDGQQEVVEELEDVEYMLNQHQREDDEEG